MTTQKEVLLAILNLTGQSSVYTECGGDFPCECKPDQCKHWWDCNEQLKRVNRTFDIKNMIAEMDA